MVWVIFLFAFVLVAALARVFVLSAQAIRRDIDDRFRRIQDQLEEEASSVFKDIPDRRERG